MSFHEHLHISSSTWKCVLMNFFPSNKKKSLKYCDLNFMSSKLCLEGNSNKYLIQLSETYTSFDWKTESSAGLNWTRQNMVFKLFWVACNKTLMTSRNITLITLFSYSLHFPIGKMTLGGLWNEEAAANKSPLAL